MNDKTQTFLTLSNFFSYTSNQFNTSVKIIRADNGTEFVNHNCSKFFSFLGIIHQKTVSYSPQQNGKVERKHQHILQVARALMSQSQLPIFFWGHAILMETHIISILQTKVLNWKTPFEKVHNKFPSYSNLKIFGCLAFATNVIPHKSKFESRAIMCCFLGYNPCQKAYKLYDLTNKKIIMSRDVVFYENHFPFKGKSNIHDVSNDVLPVDSAEELDFQVQHQDFIPSNDYNSDVLDIEELDDVAEIEEEQQNQEQVHINLNTGRTGTRTRKIPSWHIDYVMHCNTSDDGESSKVYTSPHVPPTFPYIQSPILTQCHKSLLSLVSSLNEPSFYEQACEDVE